jgi:RHS repeat-associated protein
LEKLDGHDRAKQTAALITYTENSFTNQVESPDEHRTPLPSESRTFELTGLSPLAGSGRYSLDELLSAGLDSAAIAYEQSPSPNTLEKRLIEQVRTLYRSNDLSAPLPLGRLESLALPFETCKMAFTPGLLDVVYGDRVTDAILETEGRYVHSEGDTNWWIPSGRVFYSPRAEDTPAQELSHARHHFFLPHRYRDPFHTDEASTETFVRYDDYDLLFEETRDALGNRVTVGEWAQNGEIDPDEPGNDYRVLQPRLVTDANGNRAAVTFDALGMVVGTAVMGKRDEIQRRGDLLDDDFEPDLPEDKVVAHLANPFADPHDILGRATTRLIYDLFAYRRTKDQPQPAPSVVYTMARETHDAELADDERTKIQHSFSYSDGFGREIQKKIQAEPGPVPKRDPSTGRIVTDNGQPELTEQDVLPRWVGSGWTIFNNKGKPVRQYEAFFTDTHRFEFDVRIGVSPVLFYDPVERVVATLHPNHTWEKVVFDPWRQESWDVNDTVLTDPETDADVSDFFRRLPDGEYLPTWHGLRTDPAHAAAFAEQYPDSTSRTNETKAAAKAQAHAATPTVAHFDALGRPFLTIAHNKVVCPGHDLHGEEATFHTRVEFDIEGNPRQVIDAKDRIVMRYDYDILGTRIHHASMEAGERWILNDVAGQPIYAADSRDHQFRTAYDQLRRPVESYLREGAGPELQVGRSVYGETFSNPEAGNLRGKVVQVFDQAGVVTSDDYDFKGNLRESRRQLARAYKTTLDWSAPVVPLETDIFTSRTRYDGLNRPTELTTPDNSVIRPTYNEANLLERVDANLRGAAATTHFVTDIDYDAKGQRTRVDRGNGVSTTFEYDPLTFRLGHLQTIREAEVLQDFRYTYDPAGNITHIRDEAQEIIFFRNRRVEPNADYTYDAIYRLIEATGREHLGQTGGQLNPPTAPDAFNRFHTRLDPRDGAGMGTYVERYVYDAVGNFRAMQHRGSDPEHAGWTRSYAYEEVSLLETGKRSNRLSSTTVGMQDGLPVVEPYSYDAHGNMTKMPHLPLMQWEFGDQLQAISRQAVNNGGTREVTYYIYDAGGQRVRKVTERQAAAGKTPTRKEERIYLAGFEIYRKYESDGETVALERETLHVTDDMQRIALVETLTQGSDGSPERLIRYQVGNHLGSAGLEVDDEAQIISYEEYYPFGSTSYQAARKDIEDSIKRYRYTGMERDEESGFSYHGARYYAPWIARWLSPDPETARFLHHSPYCYAANTPVAYVDTNGREPKKPPGDWSRRADWYKALVNSLIKDTNYLITQAKAALKGGHLWTSEGLENLSTELKDAIVRGEHITQKGRDLVRSMQSVEELSRGWVISPGVTKDVRKGTNYTNALKNKYAELTSPPGGGGGSGSSMRTARLARVLGVASIILGSVGEGFAVWLQVPGAYGEAGEILERRGFQRGFETGLAASLLGTGDSRADVYDKLKETFIDTGNFSSLQGMEEKAYNAALLQGYDFGGMLSVEERGELLRKGFAAWKNAATFIPVNEEELGEPWVASALGRLLRPTIQKIFEAAALQQQLQDRRQEESRRKGLRESGCIGFKC